MCFYALRLTRARDHTRAFTHKYIQKLLRAKSCTTPPKKYTSACTHQNCLQVFFTCKNFYAQTFSHVFLHINLLYAKKCAQEASHQDALTRTHKKKNTHTRNLLHKKCFHAERLSNTQSVAETFTHTFFTNKCFHTHKL